jgi:hypothetical protein
MLMLLRGSSECRERQIGRTPAATDAGQRLPGGVIPVLTAAVGRRNNRVSIIETRETERLRAGRSKQS